MIEFKLETAATGAEGAPAVSIIGIGGAGANVLDHIALEGMDGVELISMNCDVRSLTSSMAQRKVQLGKTLTQGLGCGGDPELGQEAAMSSIEDIREALGGRRMIFVCVGLGGGTGSGAAPMITRLARETGAFVIVFATMPFIFEGKRRMQQAQAALEEIRRYANALVCFENDKMGELVLPKKGVTEAFEVADKIICQSVRAVTTVATQPGLIRIGMDDLVTALKNADSRCLFGFGQARGEARATEALQLALKSPLLDRGQLLEKARNVLVHICGGATLTLFEIETLMRELTKHVSDDAQILFGAASDNKLADSLSVTIISSVGKVKTTTPAAQERIAAPSTPPATPPARSVTPQVTQHTGSVPILSVQPRQAPPSQTSSLLTSPAATMTGATSIAPVLKMSAEVVPPVKTVTPVKAAPLVPPPAAHPELFAAPVAATVPVPVLEPEGIPEPEPVVEEIVEEIIAEAPVQPEPVIEEIAEPEPAVVAAEEEVQTVEEPEEVFIAELQEIEALEEVEIEEEIIAREEVIEEPVRKMAAVREAVVEAETEIDFDDEPEPEAPALPVAAENVRRPVSPMRPIEINPPIPKTPPPMRKFDLREILQRQRQTRVGQLSRPAPAETRPVPAPAPAEPVAVRPVSQPVRPTPVPVRPVAPVADRVPDPARVSPIRPIPAAQSVPRAVSPFSAAKAPAPAVPAAVPAAAARPGTQQVTFDERLNPATRGTRFEKTEPTYDEEGGDLDVPTFLRKKR
jgi:cell division protein FtsZ